MLIFFLVEEEAMLMVREFEWVGRSPMQLLLPIDMIEIQNISICDEP